MSPGGEIQFIDYYENCDEVPKHYVDWLMSRKYKFGTHILPHDARNKSVQTNTTYESIIKPILQGEILVLERDDVFNGIQAVRSILGKSVFDESKCLKGLKHLEAYRKEWDDRLGCYKNRPLHDEHSHDPTLCAIVRWVWRR